MRAKEYTDVYDRFIMRLFYTCKNYAKHLLVLWMIVYESPICIFMQGNVCAVDLFH
jgi:hypothetical protein